MPNNIENRLQVIGDNEEVQKVFAAIKNETDKLEIDFNKIRPMPKELKVDFNFQIEIFVKTTLNLKQNKDFLVSMLTDDSEWLKKQIADKINNVSR